MSDIVRAGSVSVHHAGTLHRADWRVVGDRVEVTGDLGIELAALGPLKFAPSTVAREKLAEMARRAARSKLAIVAGPKSTIRDAMRWRP